MILDDFAFIYQGKITKPLTIEEAHLLSPIDLELTQTQDHALLLLHGFASSPAVYRAMLPHLTGYDRIVCPVLPGHAQSIYAFAHTNVSAWQQVAKEACEQLTSTYKRVSIVGLSLGGLLALELSKRFNIHHLYLLAPAVQLYRSVPWMLRSAQVLHALGCETIPNYAGNLHSNHYQELTYRRLPLRIIIELLTFIKTQSFLPPTCPTDLFLGRFDKVVNSQRIAKNYAYQHNIIIHWLEQSAHVLPLDGDMNALLQRINQQP